MAGAGSGGVNQVDRAIQESGQSPKEVFGETKKVHPPVPTGKEYVPSWEQDLDKDSEDDE